MEQPSEKNPQSSFWDSPWQLISQLPLHYPGAKTPLPGFAELIERIQSLGLAPAQFERVRADLRRAIHQAGKKGIQATLRLWVLWKKSEIETSGRTPDAPAFDRLGAGWGYFLSERTLAGRGEDWQNPRFFIELYLYQEGS